MAWDPDTQVHIALNGGDIEASKVTLAAGTVEVPTFLQTILAAYCTYKEAPGSAAPLYCDGVITAGCVTVANGDPGSDKEVSVLLVGLS